MFETFILFVYVIGHVEVGMSAFGSGGICAMDK